MSMGGKENGLLRDGDEVDGGVLDILRGLR